jgi:hypothetical protein
MIYYTLQIRYGDSMKPSTVEFKDMTPGETNDEQFIKLWMRDIRRNLWQTGFQIETTPGNFELLSPFRIHSVYLLKQDKKYNP